MTEDKLGKNRFSYDMLGDGQIDNAVDIIALFGCEDLDSDDDDERAEQINALLNKFGLSIDFAEEQRTNLSGSELLWLNLDDFGIRLGFSDYDYYQGDDVDFWGMGDLVLTQACFCTGDGQMSAYAGELLHGLTFTDSQYTVRRALSKFEPSRHSYLSDTWDVDEYRLTAQYAEDGTLNRLLCQLKPLPLAPIEDEVCPTFKQLIDCLNVSAFDERFITVCNNDNEFELGQQIEIAEKNSLDCKRRFGVDFFFQPKEQQYLLHTATFYCDRENGAVEWRGELPFNLTFDDDFHTAINKVGSPPHEFSEGDFTSNNPCSQANWRLPDYTLSLLYSHWDNRILSVTVRV